MKKVYDVVVVGGANTDFLVRTPRLPAPGETVQGWELDLANAGGKGANQAVAAARLGARVAFIGRIGCDARGQALLRRLRGEGVDVRHVVKDRRAPTGAALINVDDSGEKQITVAPGANGCLTAADVKRCASIIERARILVAQFEVPISPTFAAIRIAHHAQGPVVLDPAPALKPPKALLRLVTLVRPNEHEAAELTGVKVRDRKSARKAAERLLASGIKAAIVAAGTGDGNLLVHTIGDRSKEVWLPKVRVRTVDATGAGDAFVGALAVALAEGLSISVAAVVGNAAAALATTKLGAQAGLPKRDAVLALLRKHGWSEQAASFSRRRS